MIEEEYLTPTMNDDDRLYNLRTALTRLNSIQRKIILTYIELGTYTATAKEFKVSVPTARSYVLKIKNKILEMIEEE